MRRSAQVAAPLLAAVALAITDGCRRPEMQRCVDESNKVVDDSLCKQTGVQQQRPDGHGGFFFVPMPYRYYYGGYGGYSPGAVVGGGGYAPASGRSYASPSKRSGFGGFFNRGGGGVGE